MSLISSYMFRYVGVCERLILILTTYILGMVRQVPQIASLYLSGEEATAFKAVCAELGLTPYAFIKQQALDLIEKHKKEAKSEPTRTESQPSSTEDSGSDSESENIFA